MGTCAEAGVYSYIGIALYSNIPGWWSVKFILVETVIIIVGRTLSVFAIYYLFAVCFKSRTIKFKELFFISWGGMIRGVIAFALILKIPHENSHTCPEGTKDCFTSQNYELMVSTTLSIVIITTLIFATFMGHAQRLWAPVVK